MVELIQ